MYGVAYSETDILPTYIMLTAYIACRESNHSDWVFTDYSFKDLSTGLRFFAFITLLSVTELYYTSYISVASLIIIESYKELCTNR